MFNDPSGSPSPRIDPVAIQREADPIETNFVKVAVALNQHSKAVMDLRGQLARVQSGDAAAVTEVSKNISELREQLAKLDRNSSGTFDRLASAIAALGEHVRTLDARSASNFDLLSKAVAAESARLGKLEAEVSGMSPSIEAMKVHAESFPHALREARRGDVAAQEALKSFEARLERLESRPAKPPGSRKKSSS
ncbi:MAG: hypothetical protein ACRD3D_10845 [Terriglobia bacterium]